MNQDEPTKESADTKTPETTNVDTAFRLLAGIQEQIRFADTKAGFIVALIAVLFGFTIRNIGDVKGMLTFVSGCWQRILFCVPLMSFVIFSVLAAIAAVHVVRSRFGGRAPQSKVFFLHIVKNYGWDYARYAAEMSATTKEQWIEEVGTQVLEVSHIASAKHTWFRRACNLATAAIVSWFIVLCELYWIATSSGTLTWQ